MRIGAILLGLMLLAQSSAALAEPGARESTPEQVTFGVGSVLGTLVYAPLKATFCILGGLAAAATTIASPPTAGRLVGTTCRGTWVITPDTLRGKAPVQFVGDMQDADAAVARH
jgi:hypothetical protein